MMRERDIFEEIIDSGTKHGMLSSGEIRDVCPSGPLLNSELEDLLDLLKEIGVKAVDGKKAGFEEEEAIEEEKEEGDDNEKSEDLIKTYFHSMGDITILSKDEEIELARILERGKEALKATVMGMPLYVNIAAGSEYRDQEDFDNNEEEKQDTALRNALAILDDLMMSGEDNGVKCSVDDKLKKNYESITKARELVTKAKHELIIHNLRLVVYIAKHFIGRGLSLLDLIQEGNIGLMKAIDRFDYTRGFKFSTYATWWIRQAITRALVDQTKTIRVPVHMVEFYNKVNTTTKELTQRLGREPGIYEIAGKLKVPAKKVEEVLRAVQDPIALQTILQDEETTLENLISDDGPSPYSDTEKNGTTDHILNILHTLTPQEEEVIKMRFGIGVDRDHTLEEVGQHLSLTRERVRQIEAKAISKLKHPSRRRALKHLNTA